jgi:hypothetical protein
MVGTNKTPGCKWINRNCLEVADTTHFRTSLPVHSSYNSSTTNTANMATPETLTQSGHCNQTDPTSSWLQIQSQVGELPLAKRLHGLNKAGIDNNRWNPSSLMKNQLRWYKQAQCSNICGQQAGTTNRHMRARLRHDHQRWKKKKLEVLTVKLELCVCICREILGEIAQLLRQHRLATVEHSYNIQNELQELVPIQKSNATIAKSERVACSFFFFDARESSTY